MMRRSDHSPIAFTTISGFADVNGARLYYEMMGEGHPLVLIHGLSLDTRVWDDQFGVFAQGYRVIRYDVRGFGRSSVPGRDAYSHHDDLRALLEYLGVADAHILGHSMGSGIATDFVLAYPEMAHSLISVGTVVHGLPWLPEFRAFFRSLFETAATSGVEAANQKWLNGPVFARAMQDADIAPRLAQIVNEYTGWRWVNDNPKVSLRPSAGERLEDLRVPTLVVIGEHEIPNVLCMAEQVEARVPGARRVTIPGVGHMPNMEAPVTFNRAVLEFLGT